MTTTLYAELNPSNDSSHHIVKSNNDKRDYAYEVLDNGMKLLVISDADVQRAAAAVDVGVGSASDFEDFPGLAHFLEHMLFLGTDQYPDPDDYINYISEHGGSHNAFTAFDHTNYFFDIDPMYLHEGLKRFSRFFVAPLMREDYVKRERKAVDSEYHLKLREDGWRAMDALKQTTNPAHPYSRFNIGNRETLPEATVRPALLDFYQKYYSAERMSAVIIGKESTDTLLTWGRTLFADVPKREQSPDLTLDLPLFEKDKLPLLLKSHSIKNEKNLSIHFQLPFEQSNQYNKSSNYLSFVLGYEGEGSLLETLKQMGYASELYAGSDYRIGNETSFEIGIQLTDKGYASVNSVLAIVFAYIDLLRHDEQAEQRYQEIATVSKTAFEFQEKGNAMGEASSLANRLNELPVKDVIALKAIFAGYNKAQIDSYLALMTPSLAVVQLTAPDITSSQKTQYFHVPYSASHLDTSAIVLNEADKKALSIMHLPNPNPFIADDYALKTDTVTEKHHVLENGIELFYKNNTDFNVPRASVKVSLQPQVALSITDKTALSLWGDLLEAQLTTVLYDAGIAGVNADISASERGLSIALDGYQQKMPELLAIIVDKLQQISVDKATFARVKNSFRESLENSTKRMPYQQTFPYLTQQFIEGSTIPSEQLAVLDGIDEATIKALADKVLADLAVRMLVYGNETYENAQALAEVVASHLDKTQLHHQWQLPKVTVLTADVKKTFNVEHEDHAITYYLQGGEGYMARAQIGVLGQMLEAPFFTALRTEKQLGYVVFAGPRPMYHHAGMTFTIQSPVANTTELKSHIVDFNKTFANQLDELTPEAFESVKTILKTELLQKPENLISAASWYWFDIMTNNQAVSSRQAIANELDKLTLSDFVTATKALLLEGKGLTVEAVPSSAFQKQAEKK